MDKLELDNGKYTLIYDDKTGEFKALRYGKSWRDLTGDKLIYSLMYDCLELKNKLQILNKEKI